MKSLIIGFGNIGLRHAQGLSKIDEKNIDIYVLENSKRYVSRFKKDITDLKKKINLFFVKDLGKVKNTNFDLIIISTNADIRVKLLLKIINEINSNLILLEKPICNSIEDLNLLKNIDPRKIFVNFPRRYCDWHLKINDKIQKDYSHQTLNVLMTQNNLGIACNISHYIDLMNMWTNCIPVSVDNSYLSNWKNSKRNGFYELDGKIKVFFQKDHKLELISNDKYNGLKINILDKKNKEICSIDYIKGFAKFSDGEIITGKSRLQSEMTGKLYEILIKESHTEICNLDLAIKSYEKILRSLIEYWNKKNNSNEKQIMIT